MDELATLAKRVAEMGEELIRRNSKIDALTGIVGALLQARGLPMDAMDAQIETVFQTIYQKRLERLQNSDPGLVSELDSRSLEDLEAIDFDLLEGIRFEDDPS